MYVLVELYIFLILIQNVIWQIDSYIDNKAIFRYFEHNIVMFK